MSPRLPILGSPYTIGQTIAWPWFFLRPSTRHRSRVDPAAAVADGPPDGRGVRIVFFGDLMPIAGRRSFRVDPLLREVFSAADLVIGNCESPVTDRTSTRGNRFSLDVNVLREILDQSGIAPEHTALSIANNHIADRGPAGIRSTVEQIERIGCTTIGLRCNPDDPPVRIVPTKRGAVALAAWTEWLNRPTPAGGPRPWRSDEILSRDWQSEASTAAGLLIGLPHWDDEFRHFPHERTRATAQRLLEGGFSALVGHHPHVIQPLERRGDGICLYSCGNYVPSPVCAVPWPARLGVVLELRLIPTDGPPRLAGYRILPSWYRTDARHTRIDLLRGPKDRSEQRAAERFVRVFPNCSFDAALHRP